MQEIDAGPEDVYRQLLAKVDDDGHNRLQTAQRRWRAYRAAQCAFETMGQEGGQDYGRVRIARYADLTDRQLARLQAQLTCEENTVGCGGQ